MAAGYRYGIDGFLTQLVGDLLNLFDLQPAQIFRGADGVEKRRFTKIGHSDIPILHVGMSSPDVRRVAPVSRNENPDAGCHLSRPRPHLKAQMRSGSVN